MAVGTEFYTQSDNVRKWTFGRYVRLQLMYIFPCDKACVWMRSLKRDERTGRFDDGDLARLLQSATDDPANAFRARGIPAAFKIIETLGIRQSREWGVCSLNEFRSFLGLKRELEHCCHASTHINGLFARIHQFQRVELRP